MMIQAPNLARLAGIKHGFFGRRGGVSEGVFTSLNASLRNADDIANARINRERIAKAIDGDPSQLRVLRQVHGVVVRRTEERFDPLDAPEGDGLVCNRSGPVLGVSTADCAPVLIADAKTGVVGAAHAGWRGALDGITDRLIEAMVDAGAQMHELHAAIGPCIAQQSYEVGDEFRSTFVDACQANSQFFINSSSSGRPHFDLGGYLVHRLKHAGIEDALCLGVDTLANDQEYFSYRRSCLQGEKNFGLQLSVIALGNS